MAKQKGPENRFEKAAQTNHLFHEVDSEPRVCGILPEYREGKLSNWQRIARMNYKYEGINEEGEV